MLAAVTRQLELLDRLAERATVTAPQERPATTSTTPGCAPTCNACAPACGTTSFPSAPSRAIPCRWPATTRRGAPRQGGAVAMTPSADQVAAFQANGGFAPAAVSTVVLGFVFAVLLLWGVWAMRTAYVGWAEHHLTQRQFLGVIVRFVAMYLVLGFFLLS
jgi:integrating conjugative element protein (TIGR03758 family)